MTLDERLDAIDRKLDMLLGGIVPPSPIPVSDYISDARLSRKADQLLAEARARKALKKQRKAS